MYFYYWIPVKRHINLHDPNTILQTEVHRNIEDIDKSSRVDISVTIDPVTFDITVELLAAERKTFHLQYIDSDMNGFVVYQYASDLGPEDQELLCIQGYHCFKEFFHQHEFHDEHTDALIRGLSHATKLNPEQYIEHYLKLYAKKFESFKRLILQQSPKRIVKQFEAEKDITYTQQVISMAKKWIFKVRGEMIYADFLLSSTLHYGSADQLHREYKAHFEMYEKELSILYDKYDSSYAQVDLIYAHNINRMQTYLGIGGVMLSILGLISAF